jgi:hypothetical protein
MAKLVRQMKQIERPQVRAERLRHVVLATVDRRDRREFRLSIRTELPDRGGPPARSPDFQHVKRAIVTDTL